MNYTQALAEFDDDPEFLMDVLTGFVEKLNAQRRVLRRAIDEGDAETVAHESHAIKGGASNLTATELAGAAAALETAGRDRAMADASVMMERLENEIQRLQACAQSLDAAFLEEGM